MNPSDPQEYVQQMARAARAVSGRLAATSGEARTAALLRVAAALRAKKAALLDANVKDIAAATEARLAQPLVERLKLNDKRIESMAAGVEQIARQVDPVGQTIEGYVRPNGLRIEKRRVPIGVVLFFYESRPNVTSDAAALCLKSGNAVILRGGKEAFHSNKEIVGIIKDALTGVPALAGMGDAIQFIDSTDRALVPLILKLDKYIDVAIPRGGE